MHVEMPAVTQSKSHTVPNGRSAGAADGADNDMLLDEEDGEEFEVDEDVPARAPKRSRADTPTQ